MERPRYIMVSIDADEIMGGIYLTPYNMAMREEWEIAYIPDHFIEEFVNEQMVPLAAKYLRETGHVVAMTVESALWFFPFMGKKPKVTFNIGMPDEKGFL